MRGNALIDALWVALLRPGRHPQELLIGEKGLSRRLLAPQDCLCSMFIFDTQGPIGALINRALRCQCTAEITVLYTKELATRPTTK